MGNFQNCEKQKIIFLDNLDCNKKLDTFTPFIYLHNLQTPHSFRCMRMKNFFQHDFITVYINKLRGFSPQANYTDRETAACQRN
jgi:hypothetical protein